MRPSLSLLADSAAEEAGLQVGDVVLAVNGTEVTSVEHAEAVHLARKGRWSAGSRVALMRQWSKTQQGIPTWGGGNPKNGHDFTSLLRLPLLPCHQHDLSEKLNHMSVPCSFHIDGEPQKWNQQMGARKMCSVYYRYISLNSLPWKIPLQEFIYWVSFFLPFFFFFLFFFSVIPPVFRIKKPPGFHVIKEREGNKEIIKLKLRQVLLEACL